LALAAVLILVYIVTDTFSTLHVQASNFAIDAKYPISRIELTQTTQNQSVVLTNTFANGWKLNDNLRANESAVNDLEATLRRLTMRYPVSVDKNPQIVNALESGGTRVKVYIQAHRVRFGNLKFWKYDRLYRDFVAGADAPENHGAYMKKTGSGKTFVVFRPGYELSLSPIFSPLERIWRDPVIFDLPMESIRTISVIVPGSGDGSFQLRHYGSGLFDIIPSASTLKENISNVDTARVVRFLSSFKEIYYETLLDEEGEKLRKILMEEQPFMEISVETTDGNLTTIVCWARKTTGDAVHLAPGVSRDPNRFYVQVNQSDFALAQYYIFNRILRPFSFFIN